MWGMSPQLLILTGVQAKKLEQTPVTDREAKKLGTRSPPTIEVVDEYRRSHPRLLILTGVQAKKLTQSPITSRSLAGNSTHSPSWSKVRVLNRALPTLPLINREGGCVKLRNLHKQPSASWGIGWVQTFPPPAKGRDQVTPTISFKASHERKGKKA